MFVLTAMSLLRDYHDKHYQESVAKSEQLSQRALTLASQRAIPPVGAMIILANDDSDAITVTAAGTLTWLKGGGAGTNGSRTLGQGAVATVYHFSSALWHIWGIGIT